MFGTLAAVFAAGAGLHETAFMWLTGFLFGAISETLTIMRKAFEAGHRQWVSKSIQVGRTLPPMWTRSILSRTGIAGLMVNLHLSLEHPTPSWRFGSVLTLVVASIILAVVRTNHLLLVDGRLFAAMALGGVVSRAAMAVFAKRAALRRT